MVPTETFDPRDAWSHARRVELVRYAAEVGAKDISELMPKDLIVKRLKAQGFPAPSVPRRTIGKDINPRSGDTSVNSHHFDPVKQPKPEVVEIDADELLEREWQASQKKPSKDMTWNEMRAELKARGIKLNRRWRMNEVKAILDGKDAPERS